MEEAGGKGGGGGRASACSAYGRGQGGEREWSGPPRPFAAAVVTIFS